MKSSFQPGNLKYVIPVFYALGSLNILFLQSRQLFQVVSFPGAIIGDVFGFTDVMPYYQEAIFDFFVSLPFYFLLGLIIDLVWGYFEKRNQKKDPA